MKTLFTIIFVFLFIPVFSQIKFKLDSISDNGGYQQKFLYNDQNQNTEQIILQWNADSLQFIPKNRNEFIYNTQGDCTQYNFSTYNYSTGLWQNNSKIEMIFDSQNNITQSNFYTWADSVWIKQDRIDHENGFDDKGRLISKRLHYYNEDGYHVTTCNLRYNNNDEMDLLQYDGEHISDNRKYTITNDTINNQIEIIRIPFFQFGGYKPDFKTEFLYDENIDSKDLIKSFFYESFVFPYPHNVYIRTFAVKNKITNVKTYTVRNTDEWHLQNELVYHYKQVVATNSPELRKDEIHVFPNPTIDIMNIVLPENNQNATLDIYSLKGQKLISQQLHKSNNRISINYLNSGVYLYQIILADNQVVKGKLVKK